MRISRQVLFALVVFTAVGVAVFAAAGAAGATNHATNETQANSTVNESGVSVGAGQQLSTIISTTEDDIQTEVENTALEVSFERESETERTEELKERMEELRERATDIREQYREVTEEFQSGDIPQSAFAQRLALLNGRAKNVERSLDVLQNRIQNISQSTAMSPTLDNATIEDIRDNLDDVSGAGPTALLNRFTGQSDGKLEISVENGIRIEAESEDGERSREVRRPDDGNTSIVIAQTDALSTARSTLSTQVGNWTLVEASIHEEDGTYRFEFALSTANETGEAEVRVDGSSGTVVRVEEEIEGARDENGDADREEVAEREDAADEREDEGEGDELRMLVEGTPKPNATVTLVVTSGGNPVPNATIVQDGDVIGETDANGTLNVTLPSGESKFETRVGDEDAELEFEFESEQEDVPDGEQEQVENDETEDDDTDQQETEDDDTDQQETEDDDTDQQETEDDDTDQQETEDDEQEQEQTDDDDGKETAGENETYQDVSADATLQNGTVTVTLTSADGAIADATASVDSDRVGTTDESGTVSFSIGDAEEFKVEFVKGEFEAEWEFERRDGSLVQTDAPDSDG